MAKRQTALTAAAGEHYVAFVLSRLGYPAALTRGGSPTVDLMVGDLEGRAAVSIQVKTASGARRIHKKAASKAKDRWEWDVGQKAQVLRGAGIFYAFVDLGTSAPDVFIVPSAVVADRLKDDRPRYMFWMMDSEASKYLNAWQLITDVLEGRNIVSAA